MTVMLKPCFYIILHHHTSSSSSFPSFPFPPQSIFHCCFSFLLKHACNTTLPMVHIPSAACSSRGISRENVTLFLMAFALLPLALSSLYPSHLLLT